MTGDRRVKSIRNVDLGGLMMPIIAVFEYPEDYPKLCVARIMDLDKMTDVIVTAENMEEMQEDISTNTALVFMPRRIRDVPSLAGVWI